MTNSIVLKPRLNLLNINFDGYKLKSNSHNSVYVSKIENGIYCRERQEVPCYLYTRMETLHNHLFSDPFELNTVYVFNKKGHLLMYMFSDTYLSTPFVVWQENFENICLEEVENSTSCHSFQYFPTVSFPSTNFAVTSNGCGILNILNTGDRKLGETWVNLKELNISCGEIVCSLFNDTAEGNKFKQEIHCLLLSIASPQELKDESIYKSINKDAINSKKTALHIIFWFTFEFNGTSWELSRERRIIGSNALEYISLDRKGQGVVLLSHDDYELVYDSLIPVKKIEETITKLEKELPKYFFMQDNEEIKLWINVGGETSREDLKIDVLPKDVKVLVKGTTILDKMLSESVESYATTWTLEKNGKLEICLVKSKENFRWPQLFEGDSKEGEELFDPAMMEEVHNRLAHLTSEQWNSDPESEKPAFNAGQLEECDDASEDLILSIVDGTSHKISHSSHLGAVQHLFNVQLERSVIPSFCLRHDVDGLLWDHDEKRNFDHVATFNAFGYVKASKSMAKYTQASPDNSYVAVADLKSHVYVFFQNESLGGELRNRKSGKVSTSFACQLIISLRNHDQVMGFYCAPNYIFVLTASELYVYNIQNS